MAQSRLAVVVTHPKLREQGTIVQETVKRLRSKGFDVQVIDNFEAPDFGGITQKVDPNTEIVVVLGGDGTILRATELTHCTDAPILGINLGHVGFLAEFESFQLDDAIDRITARDYMVEERLVAHVDVWLPGHDTPLVDWALNDITIERSDRGKMVELSIAVDGVEMSSFGCDGVIVSTPTGSTAYAFSAGGPIIWPDVEALLMVPLAAHALFARPIVIGSDSTLSFYISEDSSSDGWICCDGRRRRQLPKGTRIDVRQSSARLKLVSLSQVPFTTRLVTKFDLPVIGWREQAQIDHGHHQPSRQERDRDHHRNAEGVEHGTTLHGLVDYDDVQLD
ncbi:NAD kinase [Bifidobacterium gallicum]|uniref:NAD kinase n=1 Tax=Bifidobacterium gallicum DSM 20093 = LMG 11596 TaxID=561180 RepID=D1NTW5_9BIFI|nr:NAD kinase [Bifidobacterium gallicum]EFA23169.1 NAD(+)/NADH kinase [Bifidobacterium gallicum DSM 20093 = LMG 11596]KFI58838.1 inorganic polyphosphate/ATP-NAD kinase [Bifidobacterium gallicum DSM 20093 = LMG 11596]